jgi:hypothetical protein
MVKEVSMDSWGMGRECAYWLSTNWITTADAAELTGYKQVPVSARRARTAKGASPWRDWFPNEYARFLDNRFEEERG